MGSKMREIHQNTNSQIKGILNPDQAKKFEEMQQQMGEHRGLCRDAAVLR